MRYILKIITVVSLAISFSAVLNAKEKMKIVTTLFPTFDFARQIGKDKVDVSLLLPPGVEPHAFEPTPRDIVRINKSDLFIYTGIYMEPWVEDILAGLPNKKTIIVDVSKGIHLLSAPEDDHEGEHEDGHDDGHHHGDKDPHIWLDLENDQIILKSIAQAMISKDPSNKDFYLENTQTYGKQLAELNKRFHTDLTHCKYRTIISGGHFPFRYLTRKHGLNQISAYTGFSPNAEPSPKSVAELIKKLRDSKMKVIYHEELIDPKIAQVISLETGAQLKLLHGAHNLSRQEIKRNVTFLDIMEENLNQLKNGLECQ